MVCAGDCDDAYPLTYPGAGEACDGLDNNCNNGMPPGEADDDGDGQMVCQGDCDDADPTTWAGAPEACDGLDNDCDGAIPAGELDADGDGLWTCQGDCDDGDADTWPGAAELCDGVDNDCDGSPSADETDADADGWMLCEGDCDDSRASTWPGAAEVCDRLDNDCDGSIPADEADDDGDGWSLCANDCDDADPAVHPNATELCNRIDDDCDGLETDDVDADGDGMSPCEGDCDDAEPTAYYGAAEDCADGIDNDCDGTADWPDHDCDLDEGGCVGFGGSWYSANEHCYVPHWETGTWEDALAVCQQDGGTLVTLTDAFEQGFVQGVFGDAYWSGYTDHCGDWEWVSGEAVWWTNWAVGQPDDGAADQQCGGVEAGQDWIDLECDDPIGMVDGFVCEYGWDEWGCDDLSRADARLFGEQDGDQAGLHVAGAGDLDGDGHDDVLIGAGTVDGHGADSGAVYVVHGPIAGAVDLADADAILLGEAAGDGAAVLVRSGGDLDADGLADIVVGAPGNDAGGADAGAVYVVTAAVSGTADVSAVGSRLTGEDDGDQAGASVSVAGDVNGDGVDDLLVGAPYRDGGATDTGWVYVVSGPVTGPLDLASAAGHLAGAYPYDQAGIAVDGAGDVNGDGYADLIIGAHRADEGGSNAGMAHVVVGPVSGTYSLGGILELVGEEADDQAGYAVAGFGDANGDGLDDVLVGAPGAGAAGNGKVYLVHAPFDFDMDLTDADDIFTGDDGDAVGSSLAGVGDMDGDGYLDLLMGAPDGACGYPCGTGMAYLVLGPVSANAPAGADLALVGPAEGYGAGTSVAGAGDVNGDGFDDLIIGAPEAISGGPGEAYLVLGGDAWRPGPPL